MDVYGSVICKSEVEGTTPEICITLVQPGGNDQNAYGRGLTVNPAVSNVEYTATTSRLRFRPCNNQPLCHYTLPHLSEPPIYGAFRLRVSIWVHCSQRREIQSLPEMVTFPDVQYSSVKSFQACPSQYSVWLWAGRPGD
jgi:hypothetical protein